MRAYILRRLLLVIPTLFGVTILIFVAMRVIPGDPLAMIEAEGQGKVILTDDQLAAARASLGLDQPLYVQYLSWIGDVLHGDLGNSFWRGDPISEIILRRAPITFEIAFLAIILSWIVGLPVGVLGAVRQNSLWDVLSRMVVIIFLAVPSFWLGMLIIITLVLQFSWRPSLTVVDFLDDPIRNLQMVIGPALVMGLGLAAVIARVARSATLEVLHDDYVRTARAKGLPERLVLMRHVIRNTLMQILTVSALAFGGLLGGSVAVERAFGVPGLGMSLVMAINERDWMMIQNLVLIYGIIFVIMNFLVDITYGLLDPRIRYS
ncbi:ABC transporter permease [Roseixanthobacter liquoris]|uniref:ABC transporter permease n=1 Tax=Roseixanthobacter liquoris TaxID=3119921 RepID=UPI003728F22E